MGQRAEKRENKADEIQYVCENWRVWFEVKSASEALEANDKGQRTGDRGQRKETNRVKARDRFVDTRETTRRKSRGEENWETRLKSRRVIRHKRPAAIAVLWTRDKG